MKKNFLLWMTTMAMVFACIGLSACGGDDDDDTNPYNSTDNPNDTQSVSLVGKNFTKTETNYTDDGEKEVDRTYIKFKTSSSCTIQFSGYWELIYRDGSKDTERYDTGEMSASYSISGSKVFIKHPTNEGYNREETIVNGGLLGYSEYFD